MQLLFALSSEGVLQSCNSLGRVAGLPEAAGRALLRSGTMRTGRGSGRRAPGALTPARAQAPPLGPPRAGRHSASSSWDAAEAESALPRAPRAPAPSDLGPHPAAHTLSRLPECSAAAEAGADAPVAMPIAGGAWPGLGAGLAPPTADASPAGGPGSKRVRCAGGAGGAPFERPAPLPQPSAAAQDAAEQARAARVRELIDGYARAKEGRPERPSAAEPARAHRGGAADRGTGPCSTSGSEGRPPAPAAQPQPAQPAAPGPQAAASMPAAGQPQADGSGARSGGGPAAGDGALVCATLQGSACAAGAGGAQEDMESARTSAAAGGSDAWGEGGGARADAPARAAAPAAPASATAPGAVAQKEGPWPASASAAAAAAPQSEPAPPSTDAGGWTAFGAASDAAAAGADGGRSAAPEPPGGAAAAGAEPAAPPLAAPAQPPPSMNGRLSGGTDRDPAATVGPPQAGLQLPGRPQSGGAAVDAALAAWAAFPAEAHAAPLPCSGPVQARGGDGADGGVAAARPPGSGSELDLMSRADALAWAGSGTRSGPGPDPGSWVAFPGGGAGRAAAAAPDQPDGGVLAHAAGPYTEALGAAGASTALPLPAASAANAFVDHGAGGMWPGANTAFGRPPAQRSASGNPFATGSPLRGSASAAALAGLGEAGGRAAGATAWHDSRASVAPPLPPLPSSVSLPSLSAAEAELLYVAVQAQQIGYPGYPGGRAQSPGALPQAPAPPEPAACQAAAAACVPLPGRQPPPPPWPDAAAAPAPAHARPDPPSPQASLWPGPAAPAQSDAEAAAVAAWPPMSASDRAKCQRAYDAKARAPGARLFTDGRWLPQKRGRLRHRVLHVFGALSAEARLRSSVSLPSRMPLRDVY